MKFKVFVIKEVEASSAEQAAAIIETRFNTDARIEVYGYTDRGLIRPVPALVLDPSVVVES